MSTRANKPRLTGERTALVFACAMMLLAVLQLGQAMRRAQDEDYLSSSKGTALFDKEPFEGILTENYVSQFWDPLTTFNGTPLYRRSTGTSLTRPVLEAHTIGQTESGHTLYRAQWLEDAPEGIYVLKIGPTDVEGRARFVEVGPQIYSREDYNPPAEQPES